MTLQNSVDGLLGDIFLEYQRSMFGNSLFNSPHEGCAVIREEFEELWDCVKTNQPPYAVRHEAIQAGAMCLKFLLSMPHWEPPKRKE